MAKRKMTIDDARYEMFKMLREKDMGDDIYELAQKIFQGCINVIETNTEITDKEEYLDRDEEWYDAIQEEFYQGVYDKAKLFLDGQA